MNVIYVTGNANKATYFSKMVGMDIPHKKVDIDEIQSLNLSEVVEHKVKEAYRLLKRPVIVEDTKLIFHALGKLPGPFIKFFLEELGTEGLCALVRNYRVKSATAGAAIAYYDGTTLKIFESSLDGVVVDKPRGESNFGWNPVFQPLGSKKTMAEMTEAEFESYYQKVKPFNDIADFLRHHLT